MFVKPRYYYYHKKRRFLSCVYQVLLQLMTHVSIQAVTNSCFEDNVHKAKGRSLKYLGYNAVGYPSAVFVPASSVFATVVRFVSEFAVNKHNYQMYRIKECNGVRETCGNKKMLTTARRIRETVSLQGFH